MDISGGEDPSEACKSEWSHFMSDLNARQRPPTAREHAYIVSSVWKTFIKDQL